MSTSSRLNTESSCHLKQEVDTSSGWAPTNARIFLHKNGQITHDS